MAGGRQPFMRGLNQLGRLAIFIENILFLIKMINNLMEILETVGDQRNEGRQEFKL